MPTQRNKRNSKAVNIQQDERITQHTITMSKKIVRWLFILATVYTLFGFFCIILNKDDMAKIYIESVPKFMTLVGIYFGKSGVENIFKYNKFGNNPLSSLPDETKEDNSDESESGNG